MKCSLFKRYPAVIGMVHLPALPGSPGWQDNWEHVLERAVTDAQTLEAAGADGIIVENFFDAPFTKGRVGAVTTAALSLCVTEIIGHVSVPVGINVLRNDALTAMSIAAVTKAAFIRVNVLTHAMVTDQGIIEGCSYELSRLRSNLRCKVQVFADVMVKHAYPLGDPDLETAAKDIAQRGGADVVIVSGQGTGAEIKARDLELVRRAVPGLPLASGSGVTIDNLDAYRRFLDIIIIGTWLKKDGLVENPVDIDRARRFVSKVRGGAVVAGGN